MPANELYGMRPMRVAFISSKDDEDQITVVGHFDTDEMVREWAEIDGARLLNPEVHAMTSYQVITPVGAGRLLTGRYVSGSSTSDGFFRAGHGVTSGSGETRDGVHTVAITRIPVRDDLHPDGVRLVLAPIGIFASSQDASLWLNLFDSFYPNLKVGEASFLRPVLDPDDLIRQIDVFREKGEVTFA